jgi:hypothetical protein
MIIDISLMKINEINRDFINIIIFKILDRNRRIEEKRKEFKVLIFL